MVYCTAKHRISWDASGILTEVNRYIDNIINHPNQEPFKSERRDAVNNCPG